MKNYISLLLAFFLILGSCKNSEKTEEKNTTEIPGDPTEAMLTRKQFEDLNMKVDSLQKRNINAFVETNGILEVPPQNKASVSAVIGGNISSIKVIKGDIVKKGEVLAYISHPDIINLQTDYLNAVNELKFQEQEFARQKRLYEEGVGSGASYQKVEASINTAKSKLAGLKSNLRLLNINPASLSAENVQRDIPILSPISGTVEEINANTGAYVAAQAALFEIVNTEHIHIEFTIFEKEISQIKVGQEIEFTVESNPGSQLQAKVISIGKTFRQQPKAVHIHAEIIEEPGNLIPGMYVRGRIFLGELEFYALPEDAIFEKEDIHYAFTAEPEGDDWSFKPVKIEIGQSVDGWVPVYPTEEIQKATLFAYNNAYYLDAEMNKGEGDHGH
ncbi:efflux RND transporter periplasmic adaptor subunit [Salegentibacter sp. HM20]